MCGQRRSGITITRYNIDHTFRESCFKDQLAQPQCRQWSLFGGFQNHGTADSQHWTKLPGCHEQWKVPRYDLGNYTYWFAHCIRVVNGPGRIGNRNWDGVTFDLDRKSVV